MNDSILNLHRTGSRYQRKGDYLSARGYFEEVLRLPDEPGNRFHAAALYHLAQMEEDLRKKKIYLEKCLLKEPAHRMARVLSACLTPSMQKRLEVDKEEIIRPFFEKYPLNIQLQTVSTCNAKCKTCPYHTSWHRENPGKMSDAVFDHLMKLLRHIPMGKICLYLENEPLLDPALFKRIETIKTALNFREIEISTNGSVFTRPIIKKLYHALKDISHQVWISWHGITPGSYKKLMGLDFNRNLEMLRDYFRLTRGELRTKVRTIVGGKLDKDERYSSAQEAEAFFKRIISECDVPDTNTTIYPFLYHDRAGDIETEGTADSRYLSMKGKLKPSCCRIDEWLHVLYDGDIILCCMDYHKETMAGNVFSFDTLEKLLGSGPLLRLRQKAHGKIETGSDFICKRCIAPGG